MVEGFKKEKATSLKYSFYSF